MHLILTQNALFLYQSSMMLATTSLVFFSHNNVDSSRLFLDTITAEHIPLCPILYYNKKLLPFHLNEWVLRNKKYSICMHSILSAFFIENVPFDVYSAVTILFFYPLFAKNFYGWEAKGSLLQFSTYFHPLHVQP